MLHADLSRLLDRYGVKIDVIKAGRYKDSSYPFRSMTDAEVAMEQAVIDDAYTQFLNDVSAGRKQSVKTVQAWADGKIFSGRQAKSEQIVDDIGGRDQAIQTIKIMLKKTEDLPIYEKRENLLKKLMELSPFSVGVERGSLFRMTSPVYYLHPQGLPLLLDMLESLNG
jgi:protease-4